jgi:F-type H+-transporting ATPase subunit b
MPNWLLLLATEAGGEEPTFTDLKPVTAVWVWVAFIVTFLILSKVAWPGLAKKLEERELRIAEGLRKAEEAEARARELAEKQEQVLAEARADAQKLLADARAAAEHVKNDLMRQAQEEIAAEKERAKKEIGLERNKAVAELKQVAVDLTLEASARILKRELRDEDHRRLAREVVEEVATRL